MIKQLGKRDCTQRLKNYGKFFIFVHLFVDHRIHMYNCQSFFIK